MLYKFSILLWFVKLATPVHSSCYLATPIKSFCQVTCNKYSVFQVIPYIASQFRKDKIWLRRTKPAKREYQIVLAIDDSSSMADNHSKEVINYYKYLISCYQ